jgi:hypothetical protein
MADPPSDPKAPSPTPADSPSDPKTASPTPANPPSDPKTASPTPADQPSDPKTASPTPAEKSSDDLLGFWAKLIPFQLGLLFLLGWTYHRNYFSGFGIDQRTLELSFYADASQGLGMFLSDGTTACIVGLFIAMPIAIAVLMGFFNKSKSSQHLVIAISMTALAILGWRKSGELGRSHSDRDRSDDSSLPTISFRRNEKSYTGRLVYVKADTYFIHKQISLDSNDPPDYQLHIFKLPEISNITVIEQPSK